VSAVQTIDVERTASGIVDVPATNRTWNAQLVLLAMGFSGPANHSFLQEFGLSLNDHGTITVDSNKMTSQPGIFAAGDMERGQSLVVWAIADGRRAAQGVKAYLSSLAREV